VIGFTLAEKVVEVFVFFGLFERENSLNNNEKNDSGGENIDFSAVILFAFLDLWCHVGHGATIGLQPVDFLVGCEAEISDFQVHLVIDEDILKFEVSVNDAFSLHVGQNIKHLAHEVSASVFSHASHCLADVKEKSACNVLK